MIRDLRASWRGGLAFTGVFLVIAVGRLALMGPPVSLVALIWSPALLLNLAVVVGVGCLLTVPLARLVRRFPERHRLLIGAWALALPFAAFGAVVGGLFGPLGVLLTAGVPVTVALGVARIIVGLTPGRSGSGSGPEPASGIEPPTC